MGYTTIDILYTMYIYWYSICYMQLSIFDMWYKLLIFYKRCTTIEIDKGYTTIDIDKWYTTINILYEIYSYRYLKGDTTVNIWYLTYNN